MKKIIALFLVVFAFTYTHIAHAAYAQLKPPPGWSQGMGAAVPGQAGVFAFGSAANASSFKGTTVLTNAALSVAGQYVVVPVAMRTAANAAAVAAEYSFGNPLLFAAALAAPFAYNYYKSSGFTVIDGKWQKQKFQPCNGTCLEWSVNGQGEFIWASSITAAASAWATANSVSSSTDSIAYSVISCNQSASSCKFNQKQTIKNLPPDPDSVSNVVMTFYMVSQTTPNGTPYLEPATKEGFINDMKDKQLPDQLPKELPLIQLPIEMPILNPNPAIDPLPAPAAKPVARPLWIPTGDPVASSPATNPQTWNQPGQNVTGSPTNSDPWRVNVEPLPKTKTNSTPNTGAETITDPVVGNPVDPSTPAPESDPLCTLFPDIVACAKLGTPAAPSDVQNTDKPMTITKEPGFGPSDGSCPAPRSINLSFGTVDMPWTSICGLAEGMRPFFIAFAYLGAALSFFGIGRKA